MKPIKKLNGKTIAIVGLGKSWFDFCLAKSHGVQFDEVWAINAVASVIFHDRVFMMDPPSRFLDTDHAGGQTDSMKELLTNHNKPIYTCEIDERCKNLVEYPIKEIVKTTNCHYLNNTGSLLDTNLPGQQRLYGYHRLQDPYVPVQGNDGIELKKISEMAVQKHKILPQVADRFDSHLQPPEPNKW
jgi:hypothetical protein